MNATQIQKIENILLLRVLDIMLLVAGHLIIQKNFQEIGQSFLKVIMVLLKESPEHLGLVLFVLPLKILQNW